MARGGGDSGDLVGARKGWLSRAGLGVMGLLLFIFPIPHTITLRYVLLLVTLGIFLYLASKRQASAVLRRLVLPLGLLGALLVWIFVSAVFIGDLPIARLSEPGDQWLMAVLALTAGLAAGIALEGNVSAERRALQVVFVVLLAHVLIADFQVLRSTSFGNIFTVRAQGLTAGPDQASYLTNMLVAFLVSELLVRFSGKPSGLAINTILFSTAWTIGVVGLYAAGTRNSIPALTVMCGAAILLYFLHVRNPRRLIYVARATVLLVMLVASLAYTSMEMKRGTDWGHVWDTAAIAWDTETYKGWLNREKYGLPTLPNGRSAEESTYLRVAWLKEGAHLVGDYPLGIGFSRNAFGHGLTMKYGEGTGHSHSGVIDLAIGTGLPGLLLWLAFLACLARSGWRQFNGPHAFAALALLMVVLDYSTRMFLDSIVKDHMLQQFMLVVGLLAVLATRPVTDAR